MDIRRTAPILVSIMDVADSADAIVQVLIVGGGLAALESILALRALFGGRAFITLVSPELHLVQRPAAILEAFGEDSSFGPPSAPDSPAPPAPLSYDLRAICEDLDVTFRHDRLDALAPKHHRVRLASLARLHYDVLILALGARATATIPGAFTFRDRRDVPQFRHLLTRVRAGDIRHLLFAIPSGCTWPLALYEFALMTAADAKRHGVRVEVSLLSPEAAPLGRFGLRASELLAGVLADHGVRFRPSSIPCAVTTEGALALHFDGAIEADRVIAAPQLYGPRIAGLPSDWWGFVPTDSHGRVEALTDVYAAGDMTAFPCKGGALAVQQADCTARDIASARGFRCSGEESQEHVLCARLLGGGEPLFLRLTLDERGRALHSSLLREAPTSAPADVTKVFGRHLSAYLDDIEPLAAAS